MFTGRFHVQSTVGNYSDEKSEKINKKVLRKKGVSGDIEWVKVHGAHKMKDRIVI